MQVFRVSADRSSGWLAGLDGWMGTSSGRHAQTYNTRVQSKVRSLTNLAAASATCQPAAAARRGLARMDGGQTTAEPHPATHQQIRRGRRFAVVTVEKFNQPPAAQKKPCWFLPLSAPATTCKSFGPTPSPRIS